MEEWGLLIHISTYSVAGTSEMSESENRKDNLCGRGVFLLILFRAWIFYNQEMIAALHELPLRMLHPRPMPQK